MSSRGKQTLLGCAIGCAAVGVLAIATCVGFVVWVGRPGTLLEPSVLLEPDTTAYAEWTLRLEDPGTERAFQQALAELNRLRRVPGNFLPEFLVNLSAQRDEKKMREIFPLVVTWSLRPGSEPGRTDPLVAISLPKLGNRTVLMDWTLGWVAGRDGDLVPVEHAGEQIYRAKRGGYAFFIRPGNVFLAGDLDTARRAVDALDGPRNAATDSSELTRRLAELPADRPLRGAAVNADEAGAVLRVLCGERLAAEDLGQIEALSFAGGFTDRATFEATLNVFSPDSGWSATHGAALAQALTESLSTETRPAHAEVEALVDRTSIRLAIDEPGPVMRDRVEEFLRRHGEPAEESAGAQ